MNARFAACSAALGASAPALAGPCDAPGAPPDRLEHVIVIAMENKDLHSVTGSASAPYFTSLVDQCGSASRFLDDLFLSPFVGHRVSDVRMNLFAVLRAIEAQLGVGYLGCAGGTPPGGVGECPPGSTADLRTIFGI